MKFKLPLLGVFLLLMGVVACGLYGYQLKVAHDLEARPWKEQRILLDLARSVSKEAQIEGVEFRIPAGVSFYGCNFAAFEVLWRRCYTVLAYLPEKYSVEAFDSVLSDLAHPCKKIRSDESEARHILGCDESDKDPFTVSLVGLSVRTTVYPDGSKANDFIHQFTLKRRGG